MNDKTIKEKEKTSTENFIFAEEKECAFVCMLETCHSDSIKSKVIETNSTKKSNKKHQTLQALDIVHKEKVLTDWDLYSCLFNGEK
jgi:hypothetical protein